MNEAITTKANAHPCLGAAVLSRRRMPNDRSPETKKTAVSSEVRAVNLKISCL
jgi:hypothetical protein